MNTIFEFDHCSLPHLAGSIETFIQQDPGNRGLSRWAIKEQLFPAATSLANGRHILLMTGFYILTAGTIETDGPPGTIILADTLGKMGKGVTVLTDAHAQPIMRAGLDAIGCNAELLTFARDDKLDYEAIVQHDTTHCVALERPGRAADGYHHNFRGKVISDHIVPLDDIFVTCRSNGIITAGIGDGGNELGMGNVSKSVDTHISPGRPYSCTIPSDFCICAGVSNWAGYALAALLSITAGKNLMADSTSFSSLLDILVKAGAVDGVTAKREATVDGLPRSWEEGIYWQMYHLIA